MLLLLFQHKRHGTLGTIRHALCRFRTVRDQHLRITGASRHEGSSMGSTKVSYIKFMLLATAALLLSACGGGGSDGDGFLPNQDIVSDLTITTDQLDSVAQLPYSAVLEAAGGVAPYSWSLVSDGGTGFTIDSSGVLRANTGVDEGTYGLTFRVEDSRGTSVERSLTLVVSVGVFSIVTTALPQAPDGGLYSTVLEADGGTTPFTWELLDDGGTGFTMTPTGILSGNARNPGSYGLTLAVTDATGTTIDRSFVLTITGVAPTPLTVSTNTLGSATQGSIFAAALLAVGGSGDYNWTLVSDGGTNLRLSVDGLLSGRVPGTVGTWGITAEVSDGLDTVVASLVLSVTEVDAAPITISTTPLPSATVDVPYAAVLTASGGSGNYSWTLLDNGGSGLTVTTGGVVRGTPTTPGNFGLTVRAFDGFTTSNASLTLIVAGFDAGVGTLAVQTVDLPDATAGQQYASILTATGGNGVYTWSVISDGGSGLTLNGNTGLLSGVAPAAGIYTLLIEVASGGVTVPQQLNLTVQP